MYAVSISTGSSTGMALKLQCHTCNGLFILYWEQWLGITELWILEPLPGEIS